MKRQTERCKERGMNLTFHFGLKNMRVKQLSLHLGNENVKISSLSWCWILLKMCKRDGYK
jgi:hypothetical protein